MTTASQRQASAGLRARLDERRLDAALGGLAGELYAVADLARLRTARCARPCPTRVSRARRARGIVHALFDGQVSAPGRRHAGRRRGAALVERPRLVEAVEELAAQAALPRGRERRLARPSRTSCSASSRAVDDLRRSSSWRSPTPRCRRGGKAGAGPRACWPAGPARPAPTRRWPHSLSTPARPARRRGHRGPGRPGRRAARPRRRRGPGRPAARPTSRPTGSRRRARAPVRSHGPAERRDRSGRRRRRVGPGRRRGHRRHRGHRSSRPAAARRLRPTSTPRTPPAAAGRTRRGGAR